MAYNEDLSACTTVLTDGANALAEVKENFRALKEDKIVVAASATTADSATKLETARTINGVAFDGTEDITITQVNGKDIVTADEIPTSLPANGGDADTVDGKHAVDFAPAGYVPPNATETTDGSMSAVDKTKLDGIEADAQVNQNTFSNVVVNGTTIQADSQTDTIELEAGENIALTADVTNEKVTIAITGQVASAAQADSAKKLTTAHTINDIAFDGSTDITITQINSKYIATVDQIPATSAVVPIGGIILWSGSIATIPSGYVLCDGNDGTPNLTDRFIIGAGNSYSVEATGGETTHTLTIDEMPSHSHVSNGLKQSTGIYYEIGHSSGEKGYYINTSTTTSSYTGGGQAHNIMPPYYSLAYIMRIS